LSIPLQFEVVFKSIDELSDKLSAVGQSLMDLGNRIQEVGKNLGGLGERMVGFGEGLGLTAALASEGADQLHQWSEAVSEPAEAMQKNMAGIAAMTGLAADALDIIKRHAVEFSAAHPGAVAEEWIAGFTRMRGIFHNTAQAMKAEDISVMLKQLGIDSDSATRLIATGWSKLGTQAAQTGDEFTRTMQVFGLAPEQTNQFAMAVGRLGAGAAAAHASLSEVLALGGEAQQLLGGGRGATTFASIIQNLETAAAKGKATIDFSHGLIVALQQLSSQLSGTSAEKIAALAQMGFGSQAPQLLKLLDNLDEIAAKQKQIGEASGALAKAYGTATDNMADAITRLNQNWSNLADALTSPALGIQARATNYLSNAIAALTTRVEHHSAIVGVAALAVTGLGSAAYHGIQALPALGTMSIFAGQGLRVVQWLAKSLDFESLALRGIYAAEAVNNLGSSLLGAIPSISRMGDAISGLGATLLTNPITWYVAGAVALGAAAYEIYEHWDTVSAWLRKFWAWLTSSHWGAALAAALTGPLGAAALEVYKHWDGIKNVFTSASDWLKTAGINMMKSFGEGILAGIEYPFKAAWQVAEKVGRLFHFHSPSDEGPLRSAVLNFRFSEELAKHIKPAPIIGPAHELAAGIAGAAPRGAAGSGSITINYSPQVIIQDVGSAKDEFVKALRQHADELVRIVESKLARAARLSFT
jgi:hypothetical protein